MYGESLPSAHQFLKQLIPLPIFFFATYLRTSYILVIFLLSQAPTTNIHPSLPIQLCVLLTFKLLFLKVIHSQFLLPVYSWMCSLPLEDI